MKGYPSSSSSLLLASSLPLPLLLLFLEEGVLEDWTNRIWQGFQMFFVVDFGDN